MKIYERNGRYLVILGHIPQWLVVDDFGLSILRRIVSNDPLERIQSQYQPDRREEVNATYYELLPLVKQMTNRDSPIIGNVLTAKTTVALISITRNCNLQSICPHCYVDAGESKAPELTCEEHNRLAIQIRQCLTPDSTKIYKVNLTGGEPFFHRKIIRIIKSYRDAGLEVNMSTNALLIKKSDISALKDAEVVLSISLDGATPSTHDRIRGPGSWIKVTRKICELVGSGVKIGINCLLHEGNFQELEQIVALTYKLGCSGFNPINLIQLGRACRSTLCRVSEVEVFRRIANYLIKHPEQLHLFEASSLFSSLGAALLVGVTCESCGVGNRPCVYIDETGSVYPCPNTQREEFSLGNIRRSSLFECIRTDHPVLERLKLLRVDTLNDQCSSCDVRFFCGGDCRGETYNVSGNLLAPYVACADRHDSIIELMWIAAEHPELFKNRADEYITNLH
ncbi:MAG: hypothetical protein UV99_C0004G0011 [Parcubacteria group bacterium GW2011_GWC1_43_61]|nr:MAG: hypothetical protein UU33_C0001G0411 [Candidatus Azambacteria bacterium GW2011_GWF1_41_10]KKS49445.1 MAG: hypothetical protein UV14_C0001G0191 [Candidatus Azambacteria bacterium GW2011_GWF2_42_22]KKT03556.1 MAG: hypothetical protein UV81_C0001G0152 [Candidatus Azambacteria bacterium GW2011_GWD1_43_18]KKT12710.1 MAG: hypothetical protein UV93_C0001G0011 [Candidatus Azambacteria bacterium GW2011_GWC2_43_27]KKT16913.1 MAG: hypothetical protein UV99_C0004G0011 [Parcubacteria group bacterium